MIGALQLFDQAFIGGGVDGDPNNALMTIVLYLYNAAFKQFNFGYAAAVGIILFVIIFAATLIQRRLFGAGAGVVRRDDDASDDGRARPTSDASRGRGRRAGRRPARRVAAPARLRRS